MRHIPIYTIPLLFASCFPMGDEQDTGDHNATFSVASIRSIPIDETLTTRSSDATSTRATVPLRDAATRLAWAIYTDDGTRILSQNQLNTDEAFGTLSTSLPVGDYGLLCLAHSGTGNPTTTNLEKVTMPSNKVTDTFTTYSEFSIEEGQHTDIDLQLSRCVAMLRLVTNTPPADVDHVQLYYTGGSSTLDGRTSLGCVNSRQTEDRTVTESTVGDHAQFDAYTFPHSLSEERVKLTVSAYTQDGLLTHERVFTDLHVRTGYCTVITAPEFFTSTELLLFDVNVLQVDTTWQYIHVDL